MDLGKQKLIKALGQQNISAYRVEFYIIPLIDQLLLQVYGGLWGETEKNMDEKKLFVLTHILKHTASSQKAYGRPENFINPLIQKSNRGYFYDFSSYFQKEWHDSYVKGADILGTMDVRDELGHQLAKLTIGAVTQQIDIYSPQIDTLIELALNTPYFSLGAVERTLSFMKRHHLRLTDDQSDRLLYFVDELKSVEENFCTKSMSEGVHKEASNSVEENLGPEAILEEIPEEASKPVKLSFLRTFFGKLFSKKASVSVTIEKNSSGIPTIYPASGSSFLGSSLPVTSKHLRDQLEEKIEALR